MVKAVHSRLLKQGKRVSIVSASGISGSVYLEVNIQTSTAHSFYGLRTTELPCNLVVERAIATSLVVERVKTFLE